MPAMSSGRHTVSEHRGLSSTLDRARFEALEGHFVCLFAFFFSSFFRVAKNVTLDILNRTEQILNHVRCQAILNWRK